MKRTIALVMAAAYLGGCTNGGEGTVAIAPAKTYPSQLQTAQLLYDPSYSGTENFAVDELASLPRSYTVYHVKDDSNSYELCTDSIDEALVWEQRDNDRRFVKGVFVGWSGNARYWQIQRELTYTDGVGNAPTSEPGYARIFRCTYVNLDGSDRNLTSGYVGKMNADLYAGTVNGFVEYMWQWTFWWNRVVKVVGTWSWEDKDEFTHILTIASRQSQGLNRCDLIEVFDWRWTVNKSTREITKRLEFVDRYEAELDNGTVRVCPK